MNEETGVSDEVGARERFEALLGSVAERFTQVELIESTEGAHLFGARDVRLGRPVVVKVLRLTASDGSSLPDEAANHLKVSWHAGVVTLLDAGLTEDRRPFLVTEWVPGGTLADLIDADADADADAEAGTGVGGSGSTDRSMALNVAVDLASAVHAAHEAGVVHCDIKPSNVLCAEDGSIRLSDFGISIEDGRSMGTLDHMRGSLRYVPPELLDGATPTFANDVYSLALTVWALVAGRQPFHGDGEATAALIARVHTEELRFDSLLPDASPDVVGVLNRAVAKRPEDRPTAAELVDVLTRRASPGTPGGSAPTGPAVGSRRRVTGAAVAAIVAVGALAALAFGFYPGAAADPTDEFDAASYCAEFAEGVAARRALFNEVSGTLEQTTSPSVVIEQLTAHYPTNWAEIVDSWMGSADDAGFLVDFQRPSISEQQDLALAATLRSLDDSKPFLFDGEDGSFDQRSMPGEIRDAAGAFSEASARSVEACPDVAVDLSGAKGRFASAVSSNLLADGFLEGFLSEPPPDGIFTATRVSLMLEVARPFLVNVLRYDWTWGAEVMDRDPAVRSIVTFEYPDLVLQALSERPDLVEVFAQAGWRDDLQAGLDRLPPAARVGVAQLYDQQLTQLGLTL